MKKELSIIGYGRFGRLAAHYLKHDFRVVVSDSRKHVRTERGVKSVSLEEAAGKKLIILAVPIGKLRPVLRSVAALISPGTLLCDVCSVKEQPIRWMKAILPGHAALLGMHPLFGPDSAPRDLKGKTIVLCPVRISRARLQHVSGYLAKRGLVPNRMSARRHDALMASSLFLTQFIGRGLLRLTLPREDSSTLSFRMLAEITRTADRDGPGLLNDMYRYNRHAWKTPQLLVRQFEKLSRELSKGRKRAVERNLKVAPTD